MRRCGAFGVSDGEDCTSLKYWITGQPSHNSQRCGQVGWIANSVTNLVDDGNCNDLKNIICDIGMLRYQLAFDGIPATPVNVLGLDVH